MSTRKRIIKWNGLLAMACLTCTLAQDNDPFSDTGPVSQPMPHTPDHLVPPEPYFLDDWKIDYRKLLTKHLDLDARYIARMIVKPSFEPEYSMRLHGDANSTVIEHSKEFFITCVIPDNSIWKSLPENNSENIQKPISTQTIKASISEEYAKRVNSVWNEMIFQTRYPRKSIDGVDGITIEFATLNGHGETWSPDEGTAPALLWELGEILIAYCKGSEEERKPLLAYIDAKLSAMEERLKELENGAKAKTSEDNTAEPEQLNSPSKSADGVITGKAYKAPENYMQILADLAYQRTGDSAFASPTGKNIIWDPAPSEFLKALGLELKKDNSMAHRGGGLLFYVADDAGHQTFIEFHQGLGISIEEIQKPDP